MAFSDPQTITINSQAVSLNKIKEVGMTTVYHFDTVTISFQIDRPEFGYSLTEVDQITTGLKTWLSSANVQKLFEDQH